MSEKLKILLAEDDPCLIRYVETLMSQWECEFAVEQTGADAISRAATFTPDICLLGFVIPGTNSANAAIELLKVSPRTQIVLWNEPVSPDVLSDLRAQGYDFRTLPAPFDEKELRDLCFPSSQPKVE